MSSRPYSIMPSRLSVRRYGRWFWRLDPYSEPGTRNTQVHPAALWSASWSDITTEVAEDCRSLRPILDHLKYDSTVQLAHSCDHFSNYYGLNRLLVILIGSYFKMKHGRSLISPNSRTIRIEGISPHKCASDEWWTRILYARCLGNNSAA